MTSYLEDLKIRRSYLATAQTHPPQGFDAGAQEDIATWTVGKLYLLEKERDDAFLASLPKGEEATR